ncbi:MAG TPA: glycosyltransferase family 2 protein [Microbacteriaceae bacterium]|nr:glycosyltransferase family 2 protein [Microbacteriaceae bacterium]
MTRVGGVVAIHNQIHWAEEAIRSLAAETDELVVVDDGSSDGSGELVAALARELGFRAIRRARPRGVSEAYNAAVEALDAEIVLIQGGDDRTIPGRARASAERLRDPRVTLVHSPPVVINAVGQRLPDEVAAEFQGFEGEDPLRILFFDGNFICAPSAAVRRTDYLDAGGFPSNVDQLQDYALWLELAARGQIVRLGEPVVEYRKHAGNLSREYSGYSPRVWRESFERDWIRNRFIGTADESMLVRLGSVPSRAEGAPIAIRRLLVRLCSQLPGLVRYGLDDLFDDLATRGDVALEELGIDRASLAELIALAGSGAAMRPRERD